MSEKRHENALKHARTVFTLDEIKEDNLLIVLHGNQQNNAISQAYWSSIDLEYYQIEYLQSQELDSYGLFRWEEGGTASRQIRESLMGISDKFDSITLAGFSAGCEAILESVINYDLPINKVILNAPWIPVLESKGNELITKMRDKKIETLLICGDNDEDCFPLCEQFDKVSKAVAYDYSKIIEEGTGHAYSEHLEAYISEFILSK